MYPISCSPLGTASSGEAVVNAEGVKLLKGFHTLRKRIIGNWNSGALSRRGSRRPVFNQWQSRIVEQGCCLHNPLSISYVCGTSLESILWNNNSPQPPEALEELPKLFKFLAKAQKLNSSSSVLGGSFGSTHRGARWMFILVSEIKYIPAYCARTISR